MLKAITDVYKRQVLKELNDTDYLVERLYVYAFMRYYEDTANSVYQDMSGRAQTAAAKCAEKYAFVEPAILSMDEKDVYKRQLLYILVMIGSNYSK